MDNRPPKHLRTLKRGDVREDGMVFWQYQPSSLNGEAWVTLEELEKRRLEYKLKHRNAGDRKNKSCPIQRRFRNNLRSRVIHAMQRNSKSVPTESLVGCTMEELKDYVESKFQEGMTWENYGEWHIDHIIPCSSFDLSVDEQQARCFHFSNMQPLWAVDNMKKGSKLFCSHSLTAAQQVSTLEDIGASREQLDACTNQKQRAELFRSLTKNNHES
jgi:hypothetical protein